MPTNLRNLALITVVLLSCPFWGRCEPTAVKMPKDAELIELFQSHRDAFERLAAMGIEDAGTVSHLTVETLSDKRLTDGRQTLSPARRSEYVCLLSAVRPDLSMGIGMYGVSFAYWRGGTWLSIGRTWEKGITYLPYGPDRVGVVVANLDTVPAEDGVYLVAIESKWYIIYVRLD